MALWYRFYVGSYTHGTASEGIYRARFDAESGETELLGAEHYVEDPSYLAFHPRGLALYACSEITGPGDPEGYLTALAVNPPDGALTVMSRQPTGGAAPCHVSVDASGRMAMVANYTGGSVCAFPIYRDGDIGAASAFYQHSAERCDPRRSVRPLGHSIWPDPTNRWALACDKGLDRVMIYRMDPARAGILPARVPWARIEPGSGPRHLAFHPNGRWAYVLNETRSSVTCFEWDAERGWLAEFAHVTSLPVGFSGRNAAADVHVTRDGRFLYATNRGQNALAMFAIDADEGTLALIGYEPTGGDHPRNFALDPGGQWALVANMRSDAIIVFHIDRETGRLRPSGARLSVPSPTCILFAPA